MQQTTPDSLDPARSLSARLIGSIKGRIFLLFGMTLLSIVVLAAVNFWNISTVKTRLLLGERYDDLLNDILEVRRYEKNFLYFNDARSLIESIDYLGHIDALVAELRGDLLRVVGEDALNGCGTNLANYKERVQSLANNGVVDHEEVRSLGKKLLDAASSFLTIKRARIHRAIVHTSMIPFALLGILLILMVLVSELISRGLLKPLDVVMATTQRVARGDFRPIELAERQAEEIDCLIGAFNRMAQELETNQEDLLQARKLSALGTFTAGIAHELNNPINNIALTAESFAEEFADRIDEQGHEMIDDILSQTQRAADIVKNLLDFSRTEKPSFSRLAVSEVVGSTINLLKNQIKLAGLRLDLHIPEMLPQICGNLRNLQQVFMNLLLNAIHVSAPGGRITITADLQPPDQIFIEVRDYGPGIASEILQQIFEPFFSTKEVGKGTGLGLAVTYALIKRHGGRIEARNADGAGALFTVFLPSCKEAQTPPGEEGELQ